MNVTMGLPRLIEILDGRKIIGTPLMEVFLKAPFNKGENMSLINKKETKVKYYSDLTKGEMVKIISEQKGLNLSALDRATKIDIEEIAKALNVNANYKGAK